MSKKESSTIDTTTDIEPEKISIETDSEWLIKSTSKTDPKYGCRPEDRNIETHINNGLIILDKPKGPTSHQVAAWVRDIFCLNKAGHSGTLDPGVTGVLPIVLGNATKIIPALIRGKKEYICLMQLHNEVPHKKILETAKSFTGNIEQMPPVKSAVKRQLRIREIYSLEILEIEGTDVLFRAEVEAGTYIRTLCVDFGKKLGIGAHMQELRRTKASSLLEKDAVTLQDIKDAWEFYKEKKDEKYLRDIIRPLERGVKHLQKIMIKDSAVSAICHGAPLHIGGIVRFTKDIKTNDIIAIMTLKDELVALAKSTMDSTAIHDSTQGTAAEVTRVIMKEDTYPRTW
ncbi:MAG: RNA-guided pseudouridylation complex pseudouridine synthase subunit Cbf5 [archaeon]